MYNVIEVWWKLAYYIITDILLIWQHTSIINFYSYDVNIYEQIPLAIPTHIAQIHCCQVIEATLAGIYENCYLSHYCACSDCTDAEGVPL